MHGRRQIDRRRGAVEARQGLGQCIELRPAQPAGGDARIEHVARVEPLHLHQPIDRPVRTAKMKTVGAVRQRHHAAIDVGREPPVQPHFGAAGGPTARQRGEVEIGKLHRLFQFVDALAREEDPGHMGFAQADRGRPRIVSVGTGEERDFGGQVRRRSVCALSVHGPLLQFPT
jgi:hypothetical protein